MNDTKALNNRLDAVECQRFELEQETTRLRQERDKARSEANYYRTECRSLATRGNAATAIEETLARRLAAHKRDTVPGDPIAAAAVIECAAVLDIVHDIVGGTE